MDARTIRRVSKLWAMTRGGGLEGEIARGRLDELGVWPWWTATQWVTACSLDEPEVTAWYLAALVTGCTAREVDGALVVEGPRVLVDQAWRVARQLVRGAERMTRRPRVREGVYVGIADPLCRVWGVDLPAGDSAASSPPSEMVVGMRLSAHLRVPLPIETRPGRLLSSAACG